MLDVFLVLSVTLAVLFTGIPVAYCLGIGGAVGVAMTIGLEPTIAQVSTTVFDAGFVYEFSVVPLFVLMGNLISTARISDKLFEAARSFLGHYPGGLGMATAVACGGFAAISGSSLATAAAMSKASMPTMRRYGYADSLSTGVIAAGGSLGILIPPSIVLIIYGIMTQEDITSLFLAGILPGLLGIIGYMIAVRVVTWIRPEAGPAADRHGWAERLHALKQVGDFLILFVIVLGGLYGGIFTSTEAAAFGAITALILIIARRRMTWAQFVEALISTSTTTAMLFCIYVGALLLTSYINYSDLPFILDDLIERFDMSQMQVIFVILGVCLLLGMVLEAFSIVLLIVPIALPILLAMDVNLIWFGILLVVVTEISLISPPVGMNVFVLKSVNPNIELKTIFRGVLPFVLIDLIRLGILIAFPILSLCLIQ